MTKLARHARERLDAWREQGADRHDPMRFHVMDALEKRSAGHDGEARRLLDDRLAHLLDAYAADLLRSADRTDDVAGETPGEGVRGMFVELHEQLASAAATRSDNAVVDAGRARASARPEMELLGEFRKIWSSVRTDSQLRQSMEQAPENSGPLNSRALVQRAVALMRELSPGYLQHFLAYVDDLSWIEQMNGGAVSMSRDASPGDAPKKRAKGKARTRRET